MSKKNQLAVTEEETKVTIDLTDVRGVLERIFNNNPDAREDVNTAWAMVEKMGNQMESLAKTVGSLNRLVVMLKEQRDELVFYNARMWDEGYAQGEKIGAFLQGRDGFNQDMLNGEVAEAIYDAMFVCADLEDAQLFAEALMSGELVIDEGEVISALVASVAERMRIQKEEELEEMDGE